MCTHTCVYRIVITVLTWSFELEMYLDSGEGSSLDSATGVEFYWFLLIKILYFENNTDFLTVKPQTVHPRFIR